MSTNSSSDLNSTRRRRIVISIDKNHKKSKQTFDEGDSSFNPSKELPKLLDISDKCFHYYEKFKEDRLDEEQYTEDMFEELIGHLQKQFKELYDEIKGKEAQLKACVLEKRKQFMGFHPKHFLSLTEKVQAIRNQRFYLQRLNPQSPNIFPISFNSQGQIKQNQITQFAKTLNNFYGQVEIIQKITFKENVRESINFLRNLIEDECSSFSKKRQGLQDNSTPHQNISFNNQQLFSVKEFQEETSQSIWQQFRANTESVQRDRQNNIVKYALKLKVF